MRAVILESNNGTAGTNDLTFIVSLWKVTMERSTDWDGCVATLPVITVDSVLPFVHGRCDKHNAFCARLRLCLDSDPEPPTSNLSDLLHSHRKLKMSL